MRNFTPSTQVFGMQRPKLRAELLLLLLPIFVGSCLGAVNTGDSDGGAQGSSSSGGGSGSGTGSGSSTTAGGSGSTGGSSTSGKPYLGSIELLDQAESSWNARLGFVTAEPEACAGGTVQGSCCYLSSDAGGDYDPLDPAASDIGAGQILLEDGTTFIATFLFDSSYPALDSMTTATLRWSPGATLGVSAVGETNGVGSFSGTVVAPAELEGLDPPMAMLPTISRTADFTITWDGAAASSGAVTLEITALRGEAFGFDGEIACSASSASGVLSVPAALVGILPSGDIALLDLILSTDSSLQAANATVDLVASELVFGTSTIE